MRKEYLLLPGLVELEDGRRQRIGTIEIMQQHGVSPYKCMVPISDEDPEKIASEYNLTILKPMRTHNGEQQRFRI